MPLSDGIKKIIKNLAINYISCVSERPKGRPKFVTSYMGPWWTGGREGPGSKPCTISPYFCTAVQPKSTVTQLAVHDYRLLHQDHPAYSNNLTPSDYYLFRNLKSDNDGVRYPW